jgi:hypothetical protein
MRILVLTDSIGLPREEPQKCAYDNVWPILLKKEGHEVAQISIGAATTDILLKQVFFFKGFMPDAVIVQVGIVDCAPRFMSKLEVLIFNKVPYLGPKIMTLFNNNFIRKLRNISYVSQTKFKKNIIEIEKSFNCPTYFLEILPVMPQYELLLEGVSKRVKVYNKILSDNCRYINVGTIDERDYMSDWHHLKETGHRKILDLILNQLNNA